MKWVKHLPSLVKRERERPSRRGISSTDPVKKAAFYDGIVECKGNSRCKRNSRCKSESYLFIDEQ
jgi:hypothetical protein